MNHPLQQVIKERFGGVIRKGQHEPDGKACLLEAANVAAGHKWSDDPNGWPDLRPLNDGPWESDEQRTEHLVPVLIAYWDWADWSEKRKRATIERVVIETVRQIIAELPDLPDDLREQCRSASTLGECAAAARATWAAIRDATWAARDTASAASAARATATAARAAARGAWPAARDAAEAARNAARAARAAARAARNASATASSTPLLTACRIWIEAAECDDPVGWETARQALDLTALNRNATKEGPEG